MKTNRSTEIDVGWLLFGVVVGFALGGLVGLLNAPRSGVAFRRQLASGVNETGESLRNRIENAVPADPVAESIAEGKAAAARRRAELGLSNGNAHS